MKITRPFAVALLLVSGLFGDAASDAGASIYVSDKGGQTLGQLLDIHDNGNRNAKGTVVKLFVPEISRYVTIDTVTGEAGSQDVTLWYMSPGCGTRPFVDETLFYSVVQFQSGFVTGMETAPTEMRPRSKFSIGANGRGICTNLRTLELIDVVPAQQMTDLPFKTPVLLPLGFRG